MIDIEAIVFLICALANIICGISAVAFDKYPSKKKSLIEVEEKYGDVSEKKVSKVEGGRFIVTGIIWIGMLIMHIKKSMIMSKIIICIAIILVPVYFIIRKKIYTKK